LISAYRTAQLAAAYELAEHSVADDAAQLEGWGGSETELILAFEQRHAWTVASECAPYYLADLRRALE
jgi:hypothetical protein